MTTLKQRVAARLRSLLDEEHRDRGEVVPAAIIWVIVGVIAVALALAASDYVTDWIGLWPDPAVPGGD